MQSDMGAITCINNHVKKIAQKEVADVRKRVRNGKLTQKNETDGI